MSTVAIPELDALTYSLRLSAMYHKKRAAYFDHWVRWPQLIALVGSGVAFVQLLSKIPDLPIYFAAMAALGSAIGLVFSPSVRLYLHQELAREFGKILAQVESVGLAATADQINRWKSQRTAVETREPPQMTALVEHCQYEISLTDTDYEKTPRPGLLRNALKQYVDFTPIKN